MEYAPHPASPGLLFCGCSCPMYKLAAAVLALRTYVCIDECLVEYAAARNETTEERPARSLARHLARQQQSVTQQQQSPICTSPQTPDFRHILSSHVDKKVKVAENRKYEEKRVESCTRWLRRWLGWVPVPNSNVVIVVSSRRHPKHVIRWFPSGVTRGLAHCLLVSNARTVGRLRARASRKQQFRVQQPRMILDDMPVLF